MLYIGRLAIGLAQARPNAKVHLIFPRSHFSRRSLGFTPPANLHLHPLLSLRRSKKKPGLTLNSIFYHSALSFLKKLQPDIVFSASFPKLWSFLLKNLKSKNNKEDNKKYFLKTRFIYELHELAQLKKDLPRKKFHQELDMLESSDVLLATTRPLVQKLAHWSLDAHHLPLACAYHPADFPAAPIRTPGAPLRVGYLGSVYFEQGIQWLARHWHTDWGQLHIAGGPVENIAQGVHLHGRLNFEQIKNDFLPNIDILVIPSLPVGRMPYVAITKSYDYLAMHRPIIAANLPSIADVLQNHREALLFIPANLKSFAKTLQILRDDPKLGQKLAENAAKLAKELNWENRCENFWKIIAKL